jgi:LAO/AO transport system kinase
MLDLGFKDRSAPTVVKTVATEGQGLPDLFEEMGRVLSTRDIELQTSRKKRLISSMLKDIISGKLYASVTEKIPDSEFEEFVSKVHRREVDPYTVADQIIKRLK